MNKTYFGLEIYKDNLIKLDDIKKLPFFDLFKESMVGSTYLLEENVEYIYLHDWENFCKHFIKNGESRYAERYS